MSSNNSFPGGLRVGKMEPNCIISHGAAKLCRDQDTRAYICTVCGGFTQTPKQGHGEQAYCKNCDIVTPVISTSQILHTTEHQ